MGTLMEACVLVSMRMCVEVSGGSECLCACLWMGLCVWCVGH